MSKEQLKLWLVGSLRVVLGLEVVLKDEDDDGFSFLIPNFGTICLYPGKKMEESIRGPIEVDGWMMSYEVDIPATRDSPPDSDIVESEVFTNQHKIAKELIALICNERYDNFSDSQVEE